MKKILPLIFFGSSDFPVFVLKEFIKKYKPLLVITLKAKPAGRGLKIHLNQVYSFCLQKKINIIEFPGWNKLKEIFKDLKPQIGIIASFAKIIPQEIINIFPKGILNVHPSLLPKYRGPNPIRETILEGEKESGTTIFLIDELVDNGPILKQKKIIINEENYKELEQKLAILGGKMLIEIIESYLNEKITLYPQNNSQATYTKKTKKEDGLLNLNDSYEIWQRKIRAFNPWPGTFFYLDNKILKIYKIEKIDKNHLPPKISEVKIGNFFKFKNELGLRLNDAFIFLKEVQLENKKKMSGKEFLNGFSQFIFKPFTS